MSFHAVTECVKKFLRRSQFWSHCSTCHSFKFGCQEKDLFLLEYGGFAGQNRVQGFVTAGQVPGFGQGATLENTTEEIRKALGNFGGGGEGQTRLPPSSHCG